jgi:hypothetical protein
VKAALHMLVADLQMGARRDAAAQAHLLAAQRISADTLVDKEAAARLTLLRLGRLATLVDVENAIAAARARTAGTAIQQRLEDNLMLVKMLERQPDATGASLFLAAEVARDSLRAPGLAHTFFRRVVSGEVDSPLAPKALLAAASVAPDSAAAYRARLRTEFDGSAFAALVDGALSSDSPEYRAADALLRRAWTAGVTAYADSLVKLRKKSAGTPSDAALRSPP